MAHLAEVRRLEEWDRQTFLAFYAINANPNLKRIVEPKNPLRELMRPVEKIRLEDVEALR